MTRKDYLALSKEEKKEVANNLKKSVRESVKDNADLTEALQILAPAIFNLGNLPRSGEGVTAKWLAFANLFEGKNSKVDEMTIFTQLKLGRAECRGLIKEVIRKSIIEDIKWISFDPETGIYTCEKIGKEPPKNWTGVLRMDEDDQPLDLV
jgi:hypothetical protein